MKRFGYRGKYYLLGDDYSLANGAMLAVGKAAGSSGCIVACIYNLGVRNYGYCRLLYDNAVTNRAFFALGKTRFRASSRRMRYAFERMLGKGEQFCIESAAIAICSLLASLIAGRRKEEIIFSKCVGECGNASLFFRSAGANASFLACLCTRGERSHAPFIKFVGKLGYISHGSKSAGAISQLLALGAACGVGYRSPICKLVNVTDLQAHYRQN